MVWDSYPGIENRERRLYLNPMDSAVVIAKVWPNAGYQGGLLRRCIFFSKRGTGKE